MPPDQISELVDAFERNIDAYTSPQYKEAEVRHEFIDPFFEALGWDVQNRRKYAENYKDVIHEPSLEQELSSRAPDYSFQPGGHLRFYVEAKKPSVNLARDPAPAHQIRRYGWTKQLPVSILTNFSEFAVYDCRFEPVIADPPAAARILHLSFREYRDHWNELESLFSPEAVFKGSFDRFAEVRRRRGAAPFDERFLDDMEAWRKRLAEDLAIQNSALSQREINYAVQQTIDRIIFLRICEARSIEPFGRLRELGNTRGIYGQLINYFRAADDAYNSGLFHFRQEHGRHFPDELTPNISIADGVLKQIIKELYWPDRPYAFEVVPADILGQVYERFLGKIIHLTPGHRARVEKRPELKKASGVFYTPTYVVTYIVENTVGAFLKDKTWKQAAKLRILDPACGSGSFLLGAYEYLLNWYRDQYVSDGPEHHKKKLYETPGGWKLAINAKKEILLNNIFGVDIDAQAVEVTKLSLLLKVLEGESEQTVKPRLIKEPALPDLDKNIKCGNSLVERDFYSAMQMRILDEEEKLRINVFDWTTEFNLIMPDGFDIVIGKPPYGYSIPEIEQEYFATKYKQQDYQKDLYLLFLERYNSLLKKDGLLGVIVSNTWLQSVTYKAIRAYLVSAYSWQRILLLPHKVFDAIVDTHVLVFKKSKSASLQSTVMIDTWAGNRSVNVHRLPQQELPHDGSPINVLSPIEQQRLYKKIRKNSETVAHVCQVFNGVKPFELGKGEPPQTRKIVHEQPFVVEGSRPNGKDWRPLLRGSLIARYVLRWDNQYWIKYGQWLAAPRDPAIFEAADKVMVRQTGDRIIATRIPGGFIARNNLHILIPRNRDIDTRYVLAILNSRLTDFVYSIMNPEKGEALAEVKKIHVEQLPITIPMNETGREIAAEIVRCSDEMCDLNLELRKARSPQHTAALERRLDATDRRIDDLIYRIFGLSAEEIRLVEASSLGVATEGLMIAS